MYKNLYQSIVNIENFDVLAEFSRITFQGWRDWKCNDVRIFQCLWLYDEGSPTARGSCFAGKLGL